MIHNLVIHCFIVLEGTSTCTMYTFVLKNLKSPKLEPSMTALCSYDGRDSQPHGILLNVTVKLHDKIVLIDTEVFNSQLDYNLIMVHSYMNHMKFIISKIF